MKLKNLLLHLLLLLLLAILALLFQLMMIAGASIAIERYLDTHSFVIENDTEFSSDEFKCILGTN